MARINPLVRYTLCLALLGLTLVAGIYLLKHSRAMFLGQDGRALFYGARLIWQGKNPYDDPAIVAEWRRDGSPGLFRPGLPASVYIYPPAFALLMAPVLWMPGRLGIPALIGLSFLALLGLLLLLFKTARAPWSRELRLGFVLFALLMRPVFHVLIFGQSTLLIGALLAAGLYALSRRREGWAGLWMGLALMKFTLALPFVMVLALRRHWRAACVAVAVFAGLNLIFTLPIGLPTALAGYEHVIAVTTAPNQSNDSAGSTLWDNAYNMVHAKRFLYFVLGPNRPLVERLHLALAALAVGLLAFALRPRPNKEPAFANPLEIGLTTAAGLILFYHRYYDLACLLFVAFGLIEYRLRWPRRQPVAWTLAALTTLALSFDSVSTSGSLAPRLAALLARFGILPFGYYNSGLLLFLFGTLLWMNYRDRAYDRHTTVIEEPDTEAVVEEPARAAVST
ncbi:MAG TPA: glycosyltransferase family 87 protein [Chthonomonadaceae bacterium]|nr:glycosyltransferase family 87 protein [Chthonomonadaceae bacterium]